MSNKKIIFSLFCDLILRGVRGENEKTSRHFTQHKHMLLNVKYEFN